MLYEKLSIIEDDYAALPLQNDSIEREYEDLHPEILCRLILKTKNVPIEALKLEINDSKRLVNNWKKYINLFYLNSFAEKTLSGTYDILTSCYRLVKEAINAKILGTDQRLFDHIKAETLYYFKDSEERKRAYENLGIINDDEGRRESWAKIFSDFTGKFGDQIFEWHKYKRIEHQTETFLKVKKVLIKEIKRQNISKKISRFKLFMANQSLYTSKDKKPHLMITSSRLLSRNIKKKCTLNSILQVTKRIPFFHPISIKQINKVQITKGLFKNKEYHTNLTEMQLMIEKLMIQKCKRKLIHKPKFNKFWRKIDKWKGKNEKEENPQVRKLSQDEKTLHWQLSLLQKWKLQEKIVVLLGTPDNIQYASVVRTYGKSARKN
jgi:hypothetical protein